MRTAPRRLPLLGLLCALPACALDAANDFTQTFLVHDPVEVFEIVVDRGSIAAASDNRDVITLKRHTFGFTNWLGEPQEGFADGVYRFENHCVKTQYCTWDHLLELPFGIGFDIDMKESYMDFGHIDRDITAKFDVGRFDGARLASPHLTLTAGAADITVDFAAVPESVVIDLEDGDVTLALPPGAYRCDLAAAKGEVDSAAIDCDDAAAATLDVKVAVGDIKLTIAAP